MRGSVRFYSLILMAIFALATVSCGGGMKTTYVDDTTRSEATNLYFSHKDLQILADAMVDDLVSTGIFEDRPLVRISLVKNKTTEHIDTKAITDSIRTRLVRSGKIRFVMDVAEKDAQGEVIKEQQFGEGPLADPSTAPEIGKMQAAKFHLFGEIASTTSKAGKIKERYTKFTLSLVDVETGLLEWANEKAILKKGEKKTFGW